MSSLESKTGKAYWRSLDDLADSPEFLEIVKNEFPEFSGEVLTPQSRRRFLKLMGASMALAGVTSCRWPEEEIVPFAHRPEGYTPGATRQYATAMEIGGVATGLLVTAYDGRPIKIEGNPLHPYSGGSSSAQAQASLLGLYDPDRSRHPIQKDGETDAARSWGEFADFASSHFDKLKKKGGRGFYVLAEASSSPSLEAMRSRLLEAFPKARWLEYEPLSGDNPREGASLAFGGPYRAHLALDEAEIVVSFDEDLFLTHPAGFRHIRDFARGRRFDGGSMSRLYAVEACHSLTGSVADHRVPVTAGRIPAVVARIAAELFVNKGLPLPPGFEQLRSGLVRVLDLPASSVVEPNLVGDLMERRGRSVIAAGPRQAPEVHALVHLMNEALGNVGKTVRYTAEPDAERPSHLEAVKTLASKLSGGLVDTLLILGGNPVFDTPADLGFGELLARPGTVIHLGLHRDETSRACHWHLPRAHYLESWGDARAWDGTVSVIQPLIEPLWGGKSPVELLAMILGEPPTGGYEIVRRTFKGQLASGDFEKRWRAALHDGVVPDTAWPEATPAVGAGPWIGALLSHARGAPVPEGGFEVVFCRDPKVHDGRFANNPWLQEQPDPLTKLTWDNPVLVGPADADALGLSVGDRVRVASGGTELELPVYVMPGQAAGSISVFPGYGRTGCGHVGDHVGFDVYPLRTTSAMDVGICTIEKIGGRYPLATTQDHWAIDPLGAAARESRLHMLVREAEIEDYRHDPKHAIHGDHHYVPVSLWKEHDYPGHRWAMSIDLNACVGCGACTVACQAENNIPVVGKEEVTRGREMHWLRIDRYFSGDPEAPAVSHQPVACQHCENAPCESVCPVAATVHDHEGLNVMVYNRCIGTRYCSNNCPYKVRRFNWFNFNKHMTETQKMAVNPEVTVRGRGVMEKCTFCVQRINAVKIRAKNDRRPVRDGEIVPACAQACPAEAIVFGDLNDPNSRVGELHEDPRAYEMLEEQNVKPRTRYLARLRNRGSEASE